MLVGACCLALGSLAAGDPVADAALRDAREIIASELFGHYDLTSLSVLSVEPAKVQDGASGDYGLMNVVLAFSAKRNETRSSSMNPAMFEPGSDMCVDWLYLHCGVPAGHVFDGKIQLVLASDRSGAWRAVPAHTRSRARYSLDGYLLLEERSKEGYVVFPTKPAR